MPNNKIPKGYLVHARSFANSAQKWSQYNNRPAMEYFAGTSRSLDSLANKGVSGDGSKLSNSDKAQLRSAARQIRHDVNSTNNSTMDKRTRYRMQRFYNGLSVG